MSSRVLYARYYKIDLFSNLSLYMITSYVEVQKYFGRQADKNRKIYNGMLKTYFYQFMGLRPPKKKPEQ